MDDLADLAVRHVRPLSPAGELDRSARIDLHFHPDAAFGDSTVLSALRRDARYHSQFVTGLSNGGLTAFAGGDRWVWEHRMFDGVYDDAPPEHRPKYGALNLHTDPYGAAPRFGSAYLRLQEGVLDRATFAYPDSARDPRLFGTADRMGLLSTFISDRSADPIDHYVEAHVHGNIDVPGDVEAIVLDPSFHDTDIESEAANLGCAIEWHPGYRARIDDLTAFPEFRGVHVLEAAAEIAVGGILTPRELTAARRSQQFDLQTIKFVWHYLARYGRRR